MVIIMRHSYHRHCHNPDDYGNGYGSSNARRYSGVHDNTFRDVGMSSMMPVVVVVMISSMSVVVVVMPFSSGLFQCEGKYSSAACLYPREHSINPYSSPEARILFSTWNLDHLVERSRAVVPGGQLVMGLS